MLETKYSKKKVNSYVVLSIVEHEQNKVPQQNDNR